MPIRVRHFLNALEFPHGLVPLWPCDNWQITTKCLLRPVSVAVLKLRRSSRSLSIEISSWTRVGAWHVLQDGMTSFVRLLGKVEILGVRLALPINQPAQSFWPTNFVRQGTKLEITKDPTKEPPEFGHMYFDQGLGRIFY